MRIKPCIEDLKNMTPTTDGVYCKSCEKTLVDLTAKNESEILDIYLNNSGKLCGIVKVGQIAESRNYHPLKRLAFALLLVFGVGLFNVSSALQSKIEFFNRTVLPKVINDSISSKYSGKILSEHGDALEGVKITVKTTEEVYSALSDSNGNFSIEIPELDVKEVLFTFQKEKLQEVTKMVKLTNRQNTYIGRIIMLDIETYELKGLVEPHENFHHQGEIEVKAGDVAAAKKSNDSFNSEFE